MRLFLLLPLAVLAFPASKFYPDDPLIHEPRPLNVETAKPRPLSDIFDVFRHILVRPGNNVSEQGAVPAQDVNTLGEVMQGPWYHLRHGGRRMTVDELVAGPGASNPPAAQGAWTVLSAKSEGITPGFLIRDSKGSRYLLKFDPMCCPEMASAADVISSKFFHALGYNVPENYVVSFMRDKLQLANSVTFRDDKGRKLPLTAEQLDKILMKVPRNADGSFRSTASLLIQGELLQPYRYFGTRADDPNDTIPHEHRRSLRGLHVFCAWLGHDDSRAINTLDVLVQEEGRKYVKHYLIDFGSTLGSASTHANSPRSGYEQFFRWKSAAKEFFSLGLFVPSWSRVQYDNIPSVGRFTSKYFDPRTWTPEYPNPAFDNRLPGDEFWAARQVMRFTDAEIDAIVATGKYTEVHAAQHVARTLRERRDAIGLAYLSQPLTLDSIKLENGRLSFEDLSVTYKYRPSVEYRYEWFALDNASGNLTAISGATDASIPQSSAPYMALRIKAAGNDKKHVVIYLRKGASGLEIVGIDREFA